MTYKVAITGEFRRGKDTLAALIADAIADEGHGSLRVAFATELKREVAEMVEKYAGVNPHLYSRDYHALAWQWWGEYRRRTAGENYWIEKLSQAWFGDDFKSNIIISDMRHHNEAEWCKEHGFFLIRITGPCRAEGEKRDPNHPSEVHVRELPVHLQIQNTGGLDALRECVKTRVMPRLKEFFDARVPG